jgi:hypothetical protein
VVMNLPRTMVPFSNSAFRIHPVSITTCPCSKLQGTLKLEKIKTCAQPGTLLTELTNQQR